jgi:hypothetical protein
MRTDRVGCEAIVWHQIGGLAFFARGQGLAELNPRVLAYTCFSEPVSAQMRGKVRLLLQGICRSE